MQIFNQLVTAATKAREVLAQKIESFKAQQGRAVVGSWTDDTGAIFERRQDGSFTDLSGNAYTPTGTPLPYGGAGGGTATVSGNIAKETGGHLQSIDASLAVPLPLPTNAAKETGGNLDAIAASTLATEQSTAAIEQAFDKIGNVDALAAWAKDNPSDFYKHVWIKILPMSIAATVEHRYTMRLPQPALKAEDWASQNQATLQ